VGLVSDHDHVVTVGDDRMCLAFLGAELVDQGEDVAVILREKLPEVSRSGCANMLLGNDTGPQELLVRLLV